MKMPKLVMPVTTPVEDFADVVFQQLEQFHLPKLALGVIAAAFGEA